MDMTTQYNNWTGKQREDIAENADTTVDYLYQVCTARAQASTKLAQRLEIATSGQLTKEMLRPDVWGKCG